MRAGEQVPFNGTFNPILMSATPLDATHLKYNVDVIIRATQLGNARGPAYFVLDLTTFSYVGEATWAAANGDAVSITFAGQFIPTSTPGLFDNVETIEVVGGTGRFEGATGACIASGSLMPSRSQLPRLFRSREPSPRPVRSRSRFRCHDAAKGRKTKTRHERKKYEQ